MLSVIAVGLGLHEQPGIADGPSMRWNADALALTDQWGATGDLADRCPEVVMAIGGVNVTRPRREAFFDHLRPKCSRQAFSPIVTKPCPLQLLWPLQEFIDVLHSA